MLNDPSPLPDILPEPPNEADYQAVYAELTATARGRAFLEAFASRNLHLDTQRFVDTIARLDAAMRDNQPPLISAALFRKLVDVAAAIEQGEAALAAGATAAADHLFATERIQDIAMAFRRREIEPALCDALEAAAREVGDAVVRNKAAASALSASALLQDLARRVNDIIALVASMAAVGAGLGESLDAERPAGAETPANAATSNVDAATADAGATADNTEPALDENVDMAGSNGAVANVEILFEASLSALANAELSDEELAEPPTAFAAVEILASAESSGEDLRGADLSGKHWPSEQLPNVFVATAPLPSTQLPREDSPNEEEAVSATSAATEASPGVGLSSEVLHAEEPIAALAPGEAVPSEELPHTDSRLEGLPREHERIEELPNAFALGEVSSPMAAMPSPDTVASADAAARDQQDSPSEVVSEAVEQPARDEIAGNDNVALFDGVAEGPAQESASNAVEARADDDDDLYSLLLQPVPLPTLLPDAWAPGPDEDPADLFESPSLPVPDPLLAPGQQKAAAVGAAERESPSADFPAEAAGSTLLTHSSPAAAIDAVSPPQPAASAASQPIPRTTAIDPLAAVLALSEEELIALFS